MRKQEIYTMFILLVLWFLMFFFTAGCIPSKIETTGTTKNEGIVSGEVVVIIKHQIDLEYTAKGLFNMCEELYKEYTGTDKETLMQQCTKEQVQNINGLLQQLFDGLNNIPIPTPPPTI